MLRLIGLLTTILTFKIAVVTSLPPSCPSQIYCYGELLHDVQMSKLFPDSKTFVDMQLTASPAHVIEEFNKRKNESGGSLDFEEIKKFVDTYFIHGDELEEWNPPDWKAAPSIANKIKDEKLRNWTLQLNDIWKTLSRKIKDDVKDEPERYSLIYVPNGFVIPGGRFRELYYWDTYWIVKGLMLCDMHQTAKGVIQNLLHLVDTLGHMPNGNRVYYMGRSQPPLLTLMVQHYVQQTGDKAFIREAYPILKKEMNWWLGNRSGLLDNNYLYFRYNEKTEGPRPESYREDFETVSIFPTEKEKTAKYISLKSAAESGWDFSSRWFIKNGTNIGNLSDIETEDIIPVDLTAIMHQNYKILSQFALVVRDDFFHYVNKYLAGKLQATIDHVLYDKEEGIWYDYDLKNRKSRKYFYLSNFSPLWTKSYNSTMKERLSKSVLKYITSVGLEKYPGGSPTSLLRTGQQWDMPNAWPPLQAFLIYGLDGLGTSQAKSLARNLAKTWIISNFKAFTKTSPPHMYEKYDSTTSGGAGGGGEYDVQAGFGWTNGVILELLNSWPQVSLK